MWIGEILRDQLQHASVEDAAWPILLAGLNEHLSARETVLGGGFQGQPPEMFSAHPDTSHSQVYLETYHEQNALMRAIMSGGTGRVISADTLPEYEPFLESNFYNLWCRPRHYHHAFGFNIETSSGWSGTLIVNDDNSADVDRTECLQAIAPLLARSMETSKLLGQLRSANRVTLDMLALSGQGGLLLDRTGRPIEVNHIAQALFEEGRLRLVDGRLSAPPVPGARELSQHLVRCLKYPDGAGGRVTLDDPAGALNVQCAPYPGSHVFPTPQRPAVIVIIADPQRRLRQRLAEVSSTFGLTRAETELAYAVLQAGSRKGAAALRKVTDTTARSQLSSIYDKTGTRRQADLVRLLMDER